MTAKTAKDVWKKEFIRTGDLKVLFGCGEDKAADNERSKTLSGQHRRLFTRRLPYGRLAGLVRA